jgi:membrane protease YdiL (CAAX protease family)
MIKFIALSFGITWLLVTPLILSKLGILAPLPDWLHGAGALGPFLAAYFSKRDRGVFEAAGHSAMSPGWIAICLATPVIFAVVALVFVGIHGDPIIPPLSHALTDSSWIASLIAGSLFYGFGEEAGWRGWLQPYLQSRHSVLKATLIVTLIWGVWHTPFFFYRFKFEGIVTLVGFFMGLLAGAFWLAFLYNSTSSVKVVAVWHVLWNVANISLMAVSETALAVLNALMMILGFGVAFAYTRHGLCVRKVS